MGLEPRNRATAGPAEAEVPDRRVHGERLRAVRGLRHPETVPGGARPPPQLRQVRLIMGEPGLRVRGDTQPAGGLEREEHPEPAPLLRRNVDERREDVGADPAAAEWPAVGMTARDRLVKFLLVYGGPPDPAGHNLDRGQQRGVTVRIWQQPGRGVVAGYPDRHPQVEQGGTAADRELPGGRVGDRQPAARVAVVGLAGVGAQLEAVVRTDPEGPRLGVEHGRRLLGGMDDPEKAPVVRERTEHHAPPMDRCPICSLASSAGRVMMRLSLVAGPDVPDGGLPRYGRPRRPGSVRPTPRGASSRACRPGLAVAAVGGRW